MSAFPCSRCNARIAGKPATTYNAWFLANGARSAWKQRLCKDCLKATFGQLALALAASTDGELTCPSCGQDATDTLDRIFATIYVPGWEQQDYCFDTCATCAATLRPGLMKGAERLADRGAAMRGPSSSQASDPWEGVLP